MFTYTLTYKNVSDHLVYTGQLMEHSPSVISVSVNKAASIIQITSNQELYAGALGQLDAIVPGNTPTQQIVEDKIRSAIEFGNDLIITFAAENVILGITQAGMTAAVRNATVDVVSSLSTGSLYDGIAAVRAIPAEDKDSVFVTDARMLQVINKIESYLNLPLSASL